MLRYKKLGYNDKFPDDLEIWLPSEPAPEWITDICRVNMLNGKLVPVMNKFKNGGFELFVSGTMGTRLISTGSKDDFIGRDLKTGKLLTVSKIELDLMYNQVN